MLSTFYWNTIKLARPRRPFVDFVVNICFDKCLLVTPNIIVGKFWTMYFGVFGDLFFTSFFCSYFLASRALCSYNLWFILNVCLALRIHSQCVFGPMSAFPMCVWPYGYILNVCLALRVHSQCVFCFTDTFSMGVWLYEYIFNVCVALWAHF